MHAVGDNHQLLLRLTHLPQLASRGIRVTVGSAREIVLSRGGHVLGVLRVENGRFLLIPAGYGAPVAEAGSIDEAVRITLKCMV